MRKYAHLLLLLIGIGVSFVAAIRLFSDEPAESLRQLRRASGLAILVYMFAPFLLLAFLGLIGRAWHWSRAVQQAWLVTNSLITLGAVVFYFPLIRDGCKGCMDMLALGFVPFFSWPAMLGLWLLTWLVLRDEYAKKAS